MEKKKNPNRISRGNKEPLKTGAGSSAFSSDYVRSSYIDFFRTRGHKVVESSPLVPDDPTLLFTSAGMVQFKAYYSSPESAPFPTAASVQKCLRAGGKQSDLENVGRTLRHHTFFEMLGNFSFGDYFKKKAIEFAWELIIEVWGMDKQRLWVSIYEEDDEANEIWNKVIGFPTERIVRLGKKDNFWGPVGDTGVCGPSSEIYYDTGADRGCTEPACGPGCDCDRYIEFWNLVFPQFFYTAGGKYDSLPKPGIDTGMGLERAAFILQGAKDNFHTDLFMPVRKAIIRTLGHRGDDEKASAAVNVAADHIRALCFTMAEGIIPSNEGRGYILRRLLRRSLTKMHPFGIKRPFLADAAEAVVDTMGDAYPELKDRKEFIKKAVTAEEERFLATLAQGMNRMRGLIAECKDKGTASVSGKDVFTLYDTYGFPPELTRELAEESGLGVDSAGFSEAMEAQKLKARRGSFHTSSSEEEAEAFIELGTVRETEFVGYDALEVETKIDAFRIIEIDKGSDGRRANLGLETIAGRTAFYPEGGGQVGDRGTLSCGDLSLEVIDTYHVYEKIVHLSPWTGGSADSAADVKKLRRIFKKEKCLLSVNAASRSRTAGNHTATHLLHASLRKVLGEHVLQSGSLVTPDRLRFDFSHFQGMHNEEIALVEELVNDAIRRNIEVEARTMAYRDAIKTGVMALFGEKYGNNVRVVEVPGISRELCGGTHVRRTGDIGLFVLRQESAVASGTRRVEALTGLEAIRYVGELRDSRTSLARMLKTAPEEVETKVKYLIEETEKLKRKLGSKESKIMNADIDQVLSNKKTINDKIEFVSYKMQLGDINALRNAGDQLRNKMHNGVGLLLLESPKKPIMLVVVSEELSTDPKLNAQAIVRHLSSELTLRGGGKPHMAQVGLAGPNDFSGAVSIVEEYLRVLGV